MKLQKGSADDLPRLDVEDFCRSSAPSSLPEGALSKEKVAYVFLP